MNYQQIFTGEGIINNYSPFIVLFGNAGHDNLLTDGVMSLTQRAVSATH
jgi:hypothetical protein